MNEAHYFLLFSAILSFGWIGFLTGSKGHSVPIFAIIFFILNVIMGFGALINLVCLLSKNL
jgi:hypothetical protein